MCLMFKLLNRCIKYVQMMKIFFSNLEPYTVVWSLEMHFFVHFIFIYNDYINFEKTVTPKLSKQPSNVCVIAMQDEKGKSLYFSAARNIDMVRLISS